MENMENTVGSENLITCNNEIKSYLLETSKWSKFIAIMGYVGLGLLTLLGLLLMFGLSFPSTLPKGIPMFGFGFLYILMAVLYYFPTTYLYRFSERIKKGVNSNDESVVTDAFLNLKKTFKFMGIMLIVILSLYAMILVFAVPAILFFKAI